MDVKEVLTPREIVAELDKFIIGQEQAKRMVAIAMRNRWRRQQIDPELREEIAPKNIIMIGPTGVGKTEIARRLSKLAGSPFSKVEATKFTEVGYVGRDVESMIRDLMEIGVNMVKKEEAERVRERAQTLAEDRMLDLLLPSSRKEERRAGFGADPTPPSSANVGAIPMPASQTNEAPSTNEQASSAGASTREKMRTMLRDGKLDDRVVEVEVSSSSQVEIMAMPGMEDMEMQFRDMFSRVFPNKKKKRSMRVKDAYELVIQEESERLVDMDKVTEMAKERVEQNGVVFVDEIDKIVSKSDGGGKSGDVSREGVQRDLLPIVEGCSVNTKYGMIRTDHILFIAAGAFHTSKPSDLAPELQGRFPLRVELDSLDRYDFLRILTEPKNALTLQYSALLETEGVSIEFTRGALEEISAFAEQTNQETENIGARRLYTIIERLLTDLSFEAPERKGESVVIDSEYVKNQLEDVMEDRDLSRYIL